MNEYERAAATINRFCSGHEDFFGRYGIPPIVSGERVEFQRFMLFMAALMDEVDRLSEWKIMRNKWVEKKDRQLKWCAGNLKEDLLPATKYGEMDRGGRKYKIEHSHRSSTVRQYRDERGRMVGQKPVRTIKASALIRMIEDMISNSLDPFCGSARDVIDLIKKINSNGKR